MGILAFKNQTYEYKGYTYYPDPVEDLDGFNRYYHRVTKPEGGYFYLYLNPTSPATEEQFRKHIDNLQA